MNSFLRGSVTPHRENTLCVDVLVSTQRSKDGVDAAMGHQEKNTDLLTNFAERGASASLMRPNKFLGTGQPSLVAGLQQQRVVIGNAEPPVVALIKHMLNPTVAVATLLLCALAYGQHISPPYIALALLAFIISTQVFGELELNAMPSKHPLDLFGRGI